MLTCGSRGDVPPYLALALGLQKAGYTIRLVAPRRFADFSAQYGIPFAPLPGDPEILSASMNDLCAHPVGGLNYFTHRVFNLSPAVKRWFITAGPALRRWI